MMETISKIAVCKVCPQDSYFFDNSVWLYIYGPIADNNVKKQREYSAFLAEIRARGASLFVTSLVLSEFSNKCLRISFELWKKAKKSYGADFKRDFVQSDEYKDASLEISLNIKSILKIAERKPDDFNSINMDEILDNLLCIDFNDAYYIELCKRGNIMIVTDDRDFVKVRSGVRVISSI